MLLTEFITIYRRHCAMVTSTHITKPGSAALASLWSYLARLSLTDCWAELTDWLTDWHTIHQLLELDPVSDLHTALFHNLYEFWGRFFTAVTSTLIYSAQFSLTHSNSKCSRLLDPTTKIWMKRQWGNQKSRFSVLSDAISSLFYKIRPKLLYSII